MASILVDVDLGDFDLDEILEELDNRYNYYRNKEDNQLKINDFIEKIKIDCEGYFSFKNGTLLDQMKIDFFEKNIDRIKLSDLESLI
jgi:hypothetical protein